MTDASPEPAADSRDARASREQDAADPHSVPMAGVDSEVLDLDEIERDLAAVEAALPRLDDGSYWTDEVTGEPIPDAVLADDPIARRA